VTDDDTGEQPIQRGSSGPGLSERPPRRPLDQALIVREAIAFIDENGRELLTMRRLGARLGVEAMALYRYLPGREALLDCVVEALMDELYDVTMTGEYGSSWQEYSSSSRTASAGSRWHIRGSFPGGDRLSAAGCGLRFAASAGWRSASPALPGTASTT
jgi:hypothetical protein